MALNPSNNSNLEQLALKGLTFFGVNCRAESHTTTYLIIVVRWRRTDYTIAVFRRFPTLKPLRPDAYVARNSFRRIQDKGIENDWI